MPAINFRERCEALEKELAEIKEAQADVPDFSDPSSVVEWHGKSIIKYLSLMKREKASSRLRLLNASIDSWSRASRLAHDSSEIESLKSDLAELRELVEQERKQGPIGVTK